MLFDEPMIGLVPRGQRELRDIMRALRAGGTTLIMSTHLLESAEDLCDRVLIIKDGRLIAEGPTAALRAAEAGTRSLEEVFLEITR
jgi:ABC-type multidrug transport system ATPase subunit